MLKSKSGAPHVKGEKKSKVKFTENSHCVLHGHTEKEGIGGGGGVGGGIFCTSTQA